MFVLSQSQTGKSAISVVKTKMGLFKVAVDNLTQALDARRIDQIYAVTVTKLPECV